MVSQNMKENRSFRQNQIRFVTALALIKCLKQFKLQRVLFMCVSTPELPSTISTMTLYMKDGFCQNIGIFLSITATFFAKF